MTTKLHDLATLREEIKNNATTARDLRVQARATSHDERYNLKADANSYAHGTRTRLLASGYLRGLSIREMESPFTINHASPREILDIAEDAFRKRVEQPDAEYDTAWAEFKAHVETDVKSWNNECKLRVMQRDAQLAARDVA